MDTGAAISADGSTIGFWSFDSNLAGEGAQDCPAADSGELCGSLYIYDVPTGALERVPVGAGHGLGMVNATALSADGRFVAFATAGGAIWNGVLLLDRQTDEITQISATGVAVGLSADGRFVVFVSEDGNLVPGDANEAFDVFLLDRETETIERISVPFDGQEAPGPSGASYGTEGVSGHVDISPDGRYVLFEAQAPNLVEADYLPCTLYPGRELPACGHLYLHDRETGVTELVSVSQDGELGNGVSSGGTLSSDGRWVVFTTLADNLTLHEPFECAGYGHLNCGQVVAHDRQTGRTHCLSLGYDGQLGNSGSYGALIAPDGRYAIFRSGADNLVLGAEGGLFLADLSLLVEGEGGSSQATMTVEIPSAPDTETETLATPERSSSAPTSTPPPMEAPASPQIFFFQVAPTSADPGDVVTLSWEAGGSQATICPSALFALFTADDCRQVPLAGETAFTIPLEAAGSQLVSFLLTVEGHDPSATIHWETSVTLNCHLAWFFSSEPQAGVCPLESLGSYAAAQRFERGMMIWIEQLGRYLILENSLLYAGEARRKISYVHDPLEILEDTSGQIQPPAGLMAPVSGFGLVWRGDISASPGYQESLGWALAPEFGYDAVFQCDDARPSGGRSWQACYLKGPAGEIIVLHPLGGWYLLGE